MEPENRVLLVEDEAPLRRSLEKYLEGAGYAFDGCTSACEGLMLAARGHYDIVIVEYHLPDANGAVFLEKLMRIVPDVAAIMISEYDFPVVAPELARVNVRSYLKKPFDLVELETVLSSARSRFLFSFGSSIGSSIRKSIASIEWKPELHVAGIPVSVYK